jgi:hypothetical protein
MRTFRSPKKFILLLTLGLCFSFSACEFKEEGEKYFRDKNHASSPYQADVALSWIRAFHFSPGMAPIPERGLGFLFYRLKMVKISIITF